MATSETQEAGIDSRFRGSLLQFYYFLRSSLWRSIVLFGLFLLVIGFLLDALAIHYIFAGMFGVWGVSAILAGVLGYLTFQVIRLLGRYTGQIE